MLKHQVVIDVTDPKGNKEQVLGGGEFTLRDRLLTRLLGKGQKMLVLVPSDRVESVSIRELKDEQTYDAQGGDLDMTQKKGDEGMNASKEI